MRGDPRGWRARHHREHVDGDYKHPPPKGKYDELFAQSKALLKRDPVKIKRDLCQFVLDMVIERLLVRDNEVEIGCFDGVHLHVLQRCYKHNPRIELGAAKQHATAQLKAHRSAVGLDLKYGEGIWSKGSHPEPIINPFHFKKTRSYLHDHIHRGAVIWTPRPIPNDPIEVDLLL